MPTKTKAKPKAKSKTERVRAPIAIAGSHTMSGPPLPSSSVIQTFNGGVHDCMEHVIRPMVKVYESETGAKANQVRLIDFIRWWEEREKDGKSS